MATGGEVGGDAGRQTGVVLDREAGESGPILQDGIESPCHPGVRNDSAASVGLRTASGVHAPAAAIRRVEGELGLLDSSGLADIRNALCSDLGACPVRRKLEPDVREEIARVCAWSHGFCRDLSPRSGFGRVSRSVRLVYLQHSSWDLFRFDYLAAFRGQPLREGLPHATATASFLSIFRSLHGFKRIFRGL